MLPIYINYSHLESPIMRELVVIPILEGRQLFNHPASVVISSKERLHTAVFRALRKNRRSIYITTPIHIKKTT